MRLRTTALVALLLASPAMAQTGDCSAETGTSTTWTIIEGGTGQGFVVTRYDFYASGLAGISSATLGSSLGDGVDASVFADSQCEGVDEGRAEDEITAARGLVRNGAPPENVTPGLP